MEIEAPDTATADPIADLWVELSAGQREFGSHLRAQENRAEIHESIVRHIVTDSLLVAKCEDDLVGFVMYSIETGAYEQEVLRGVVENLYVVESHRCEGIGSALLAAAEADLAEKGVEVVSLEVMTANYQAREFYRDRGYHSHRIELEKAVESDTH